jgi:hypothetical protein
LSCIDDGVEGIVFHHAFTSSCTGTGSRDAGLTGPERVSQPGAARQLSVTALMMHGVVQ